MTETIRRLIGLNVGMLKATIDMVEEGEKIPVMALNIYDTSNETEETIFGVKYRIIGHRNIIECIRFNINLTLNDLDAGNLDDDITLFINGRTNGSEDSFMMVMTKYKQKIETFLKMLKFFICYYYDELEDIVSIR